MGDCFGRLYNITLSNDPERAEMVFRSLLAEGKIVTASSDLRSTLLTEGCWMTPGKDGEVSLPDGNILLSDGTIVNGQKRLPKGDVHAKRRGIQIMTRLKKTLANAGVQIRTKDKVTKMKEKRDERISVPIEEIVALSLPEILQIGGNDFFERKGIDSNLIRFARRTLLKLYGDQLFEEVKESFNHWLNNIKFYLEQGNPEGLAVAISHLKEILGGQFFPN